MTRCLPTTEPDKDEFLKLFQGKFEDKAAKVVVGCAGLPASQRSQVLLDALHLLRKYVLDGTHTRACKSL